LLLKYQIIARQNIIQVKDIHFNDR
jgi:hypothetical protein